MRDKDLTFEQLKREIHELRDRFPRFQEEEVFVLWFLRAYVTDREEVAAESLAGASNDKGCDAVLIDDDAHCIVIVQGKYRKKLGEKSEVRNDVLGIADLANAVGTMEDKDFHDFTSDADQAVAERLRLARKKIRKDKYRLCLYFVTTGKVSPTIRKDVEQQVRVQNANASVEVIDGNRAMLLFRDYLDGVAPPIPTLDLEMEAGSGVTVNGVAQRFDHQAKIESWVISMRGNAIAEIYERAGLRLFARNIRGFMGPSTAVNKGMVATLEKEPERFFYYNNGITIVCDQAERKSSQGRDYLRVGNPQIINGQQTTRTLAAHGNLASKASVLVKVIQVPRDANGDTSVFESLVSRIVAGTNWQNAITPSDLMSNDRRQIELERNLRKIGYLYMRKRQSKAESKRLLGHSYQYVIGKDDLARAVAGCDLDPYVVRSGVENLFKEEFYSVVFPTSEPHYYIARYRMMREVTYVSRGSPERSYAKWMVLNFVWSLASPCLRGKQAIRAFCRLCERQYNDLVYAVSGLIDELFKAASKYFRLNRGTGDTRLDVSQFFKNRKGHHLRFAEFWDKAPKQRKHKVDNLLARMREAISTFDQ